MENPVVVAIGFINQADGSAGSWRWSRESWGRWVPAQFGRLNRENAGNFGCCRRATFQSSLQ